MLAIQFVREHPDIVKASQEKRGHDSSLVDQVLQVDQEWRAAIQEVEQLKQQKNTVSQEINQAKKQGKDAQEKIMAMKQVAANIKEQEMQVEGFLEQRTALLSKIGNILHEKVPQGKDDSQNVEIKTWGEKKTTPVKNHVEVVEELNLADFERSAITSGNGFYFLRGDLALLNQALIRFAINKMRKKGFTYIEPPLLITKENLNAAVDTTEFAQTIYSITDERLALIGTSEHALLAMHNGDTFQEQDLPKKYTAYSMCFRKEVGAHGINEKGLWRTHQFNKIEQFVFCTPEESEKIFLELLSYTEEILQDLKLPYRVIELCSGDLSLWKQRSFDVEVWRPTTQSYGEVCSLSNCTDYQARELGIKVVRKDNTRQVVHTLNNTALATSRIMVSILENYQTPQGTIQVPEVLLPYMDGITHLTKQD